eukprot:TRINITY_DN16165_c0_g1_i1.p1 TRINITY_DN16165_c0_g1~~TRINITY_DN16165_c0_g1_i1.p1  ORF type:complete len:134 (+),score=6.35 TRINITY_DN16165_c0_g1_i1:50-451(+)
MHSHSSSGSVASSWNGGRDVFMGSLVQVGRPFMASHNDLEAFVPRKGRFSSPARKDVILPFLKGVTTQENYRPQANRREHKPKSKPTYHHTNYPKPPSPFLENVPPKRNQVGWTAKYTSQAHLLETLNLRGLR